MRHGKKINHLGRTASHRSAMMSNMATSLIMHKRIKTTVAKAKALRTFVEPIITRSKLDTIHNRRTAFRYLQEKEAVKELFGAVSEKVAERNGGYTRIIKLENRLGDNAETCIIELVDFNDLLLTSDKSDSKTKRSRRSRRGKGGGKGAADSPSAKEEKKDEKATTSEPAKEEAKTEPPTEEAPVEDKAEEVKVEATEEAKEPEASADKDSDDKEDSDSAEEKKDDKK